MAYIYYYLAIRPYCTKSSAARCVDVYWFFSFALSTAAYPLYKNKKRRRKLEENMVEFDLSSPKIVSNKVWLSHDFPRHNRLGQICSMWYKIKGASFWRNCGAASVGKYEKIIWFLSTELIDACKLASVKRFWADVSIVSLLQSKLQRAIIVLSRKGYIVVTTTNNHMNSLN